MKKVVVITRTEVKKSGDYPANHSFYEAEEHWLKGKLLEFVFDQAGLDHILSDIPEDEFAQWFGKLNPETVENISSRNFNRIVRNLKASQHQENIKKYIKNNLSAFFDEFKKTIDSRGEGSKYKYKLLQIRQSAQREDKDIYLLPCYADPQILGYKPNEERIRLLEAIIEEFDLQEEEADIYMHDKEWGEEKKRSGCEKTGISSIDKVFNGKIRIFDHTPLSVYKKHILDKCAFDEAEKIDLLFPSPEKEIDIEQYYRSKAHPAIEGMKGILDKQEFSLEDEAGMNTFLLSKD